MTRVFLVAVLASCGSTQPSSATADGKKSAEALENSDFDEPAWVTAREARREQAAKRRQAEQTAESAPAKTRPKREHRAAPGGPRVTMRYRQTDLRRVFDELATVGGVNIVLAPEVSGVVTVHFDRVAFEQALDSLCSSSDLSYSREGNVVVVKKLESP